MTVGDNQYKREHNKTIDKTHCKKLKTMEIIKSYLHSLMKSKIGFYQSIIYFKISNHQKSILFLYKYSINSFVMLNKPLHCTKLHRSLLQLQNKYVCTHTHTNTHAHKLI